MSATKPPEARAVVEESTVIVHRTHDVEQARELARDFDASVDDMAGEPDVVWLRTCPVAPGGDFAFAYRAAAPGERGAFRAVVFSDEPRRCRWWLPREDR